MKKWIIGSLVGAIIIFAWQAASWMFLGIHDKAFKYSPGEQAILSTLSSNLTEEGAYRFPMPPPDASQKEKMELMEKTRGHAWASVIYHPSYDASMAESMTIGFIVCFILVLLLVLILTKGGLPNGAGIFTGSLAIGIVTFLWGPYMGHVWFQLPWSMIMGDLIDAIVAWGLCGLWLAWWLRR